MAWNPRTWQVFEWWLLVYLAGLIAVLWFFVDEETGEWPGIAWTVLWVGAGMIWEERRFNKWWRQVTKR